MTPAQDKARAEIERLIATYNSLDDEMRAKMTESSVVTQFIEPLFRALGWAVEDPGRYAKEVQTVVGRPDIIVRSDAAGLIYMEAKRFGILKELPEARTSETGIVLPHDLPSPGMFPERGQDNKIAWLAITPRLTFAIAEVW
jgi:hypothetical protein